MSILNVEHLTHGFGDRAIFEDVSFRLLAGEHIGLVGANGEGKSTFMNIVTGKLMPDEGKVEWAKNVRTGYLDQNSTLQKGMTIESVLKSAFAWLFEQEERMNEICDQLGSADPDQMDAMMEELGVIQDMLTMHDFYVIDSKVEEVARALGLLELGLGHDVSDLSGGQRMKVLLAKLLLEKPDILLLDEPTNHLDIDSKEVLENALIDFDGTLLFVSHDRYFINRVATKVMEISEDGATIYLGDYDYYLEKKAELEELARLEAEENQVSEEVQVASAGASDYQAQKANQKEMRKLSRRIEQIENELETIEERLEEISAAMLETNEVVELSDLQKELDDLSVSQEALMEEWSDLSEQLEG